MSKIYSDYVGETQLLLTGLKKNVVQLKSKGIDEQFISKLESSNGKAATYNEECEKLKAEAKAKAKQANAQLDNVKQFVREAKRIIKRDFDKGKWHEFGISDLR
jgi:hypothetical protein